MKISVERTNDKYAVSVKNERGNTSVIDGSGSAFKPMEMLLASLAACTVVDIVDILKKQKQELNDIKIDVEGEREQLEMIKPFKALHVHYKLFGQIDEKKAQRAIDLAFNKYCSVSASLNKAINKSFSFEIINE
ncbi:MAG: OsmC family protein [Bacteroidia bacterium]